MMAKVSVTVAASTLAKNGSDVSTGPDRAAAAATETAVCLIGDLCETGFVKAMLPLVLDPAALTPASDGAVDVAVAVAVAAVAVMVSATRVQLHCHQHCIETILLALLRMFGTCGAHVRSVSAVATKGAGADVAVHARRSRWLGDFEE